MRLNRSNRMFRQAMFLTTALLMAGGAVALAAPAPEERTLPVQGLQEREHASLDALYTRPGVNLANYRRVLLDPVQLSLTPDRRNSRHELILHKRDLEHAQNYFTRRLQEALGPNTLTSQPGPGVLRLQITVTEFVPNSPANPRRRLGGYILDSVGVGSAAFNAVLTDAQSGEVVAVVADADMGLPFTSNPHVRTLYGDADRFMRRWSNQLAGLLGNRPQG